MDETTRTALGIERRVVVSETVSLPRQTVQSLCETILLVFRTSNKPVRILYTKGEDLLVEKVVPESQAAQDSPFLTPYEMVRQHADTQIIEKGTPVEMICNAAMVLAKKDYEATMLIAPSREPVDEWFKAGKVDAILRLPFREDPDCPDGWLILTGSQTGGMIGQIEYAVLCKME